MALHLANLSNGATFPEAEVAASKRCPTHFFRAAMTNCRHHWRGSPNARATWLHVVKVLTSCSGREVDPRSAYKWI
jgi:hypothetical protein